MKVISLTTQKGGVSKTNSTINIGAGLVKKGKKVLLVDFDPQANLTTGLGINKLDLKYTIYDLLKQDAFGKKELDIEHVMMEKEGLNIIPANIKLSKADMELGNQPAREQLLKNILLDLYNFDYILIDCPPSLSLLTYNALTAADEVLIPVQAEPFALEGMNDLLDTIDLIKAKLNMNLLISGVFITMVDKRTNLHDSIINELRKWFDAEIYNTMISRNIKIPESNQLGVSIFKHAPRSQGSKDYISFVNEFLERSDKNYG